MILEFFLNGMLAILLVQNLLKVKNALNAFPNKLLFAFITLYGLHFINFSLIALNFPGLTIHFYKVPFFINATLIPVGFLYVRKVVTQNYSLKSHDWWHAALPVSVFLFMLPWFFLPQETKREHWEKFGPHGGFAGVEQVVGIVMFLALLTYLIY